MWDGDEVIDKGYLGFGILYYSFVYMLQAKLAVCLGSGHAFVPRLMRQAQRDLGIADSSTTMLIDAGWYTKSDYRQDISFVKSNFPDIEIHTMYASKARKKLFKDRTIDVLHIDTSHSYKTAKKQWLQYKEIMSPYAVITMHDTELDEFDKGDGYGVGKWYLEMIRDYTSETTECANITWAGGLGMCFIHPPSRSAEYAKEHPDYMPPKPTKSAENRKKRLAIKEQRIRTKRNRRK